MSSKIDVIYNAKRNKFYVECPFNLNHVVRALPNRRFMKRTGVWEVPALSRNAEALLKAQQQGQAQFDSECEAAIQGILDKSRVVEKKGFPIQYPFKTQPFSHQLQALNETYGLDASALYMEMGTGKSKVIIDLACAYFFEGRINAVLVFCPVAIRSNWVGEWKVHAPAEYETMICDPGTKKKEREIEEFITSKTQKLKVLIVGLESISQRDAKTNKPTGKSYRLAEKFVLCHNVFAPIDEAHLIKGHDSNRSRNAKSLGLQAMMRQIATGTPIAQGIMDLYMQFEYLSTDIIGIGDFYSFRNRYAVMGGFENKQIIGYDNVQELMDLIKPWVFQCTKEEALPDLPDKMYVVRKIKLSKDQRTMYNKVKKDRIAELPDLNPDGSNVELVAENILTMNTALQQIVSGFVTYSKDGEKERQVTEIVKWKGNPKIRELVDVLDEHRVKPAIIWAKYRREIADIVEALESKFGSGCAVEYHGGVTKEGRDDNEARFKSGKALYMVANQATGGVGVTWNVANLTVYMSNTFKYIDRKQSEDRNHRIGQGDKVLYVDIIAEDTVDEVVVDSIANKQDMADFVKESLARGLK